MTFYRNLNPARGAKYAKNDFPDLCALCVLCGEFLNKKLLIHIYVISKIHDFDLLRHNTYYIFPKLGQVKG